MKKILPLLLVLSAISTGFVPLKNSNVVGIKSLEAEEKTLTLDADELIFVPHVEGVTAFTYTSCEAKSEVESLTGFTGKVLEVLNDTSTSSDVGTTLDFRSLKIPTKEIVSMNIRYYLTGGRAFRITKEAGSTKPYWEVNNEVGSSDYNAWKDLTLLADGTGFSNDCNFSHLSDAEGNLTVFNLGSRSGHKFYVDEIVIKYVHEERDADVYTFDADEIPVNENYTGVAAYLNSGKTVIDAASAPTGATGKVLKLDGVDGGVGTIFDFANRFTVSNVVSISFRFYTNSNNEARITTCAGQGGKAWLMRYSLSSSANQWVNVELDKNGTNFYGDTTMADFATAQGDFKPFNFCIRSGSVLYVDKIVIEVQKGEKVPPVIHTDVTEITTHAGVRPQLNVTATDNVDGDVPVFYSWSLDALDSRGLLTVGTHVCTLTAKDKAGNVAIHQITFIVTE